MSRSIGESINNNNKILRITDLSAAYGERTVMEDVSFDIAPAEIVCIVGESGSGKSTLVKAIHGMSELGVTGGSIEFGGRDITHLSYAERRRLMGTGIALIPQNPQASFNPIRRYEPQFREALASHGMSYDEDDIAERLARIGIADGKAVLRNRPFELSGGMNQRIAIAAAMMFEPKLLMCDEATSALDVTTSGAVVDELLKIRGSLGTAILMVTHHLGIAKRMADSIGIMKGGRLVEYGPAAKIFEAPENEYTKKLMRDVPRLIRD